MKKLILVILLSIILIGCEISTEPYQKMEKLSEPITIEVMDTFGFNKIPILATHRYKMNDSETLYYFPEIVKYAGDTFINEKYGYYKETVESNKTTYVLIKRDQAAKIVD